MIKSAEAFAAICRVAGQDPKEVVQRYMRMDDRDISVNDARSYGCASVEDFQDILCEYAAKEF